ncbi:MAG: hypothetical protein D6707_04105, partial [Bacteroidetes bacterium]
MKKMFKKYNLAKFKNYISLIFLFFCFCLYSFNLSAINITSVQSGRWNQTSTWDCGCVPSATDDVTIASGHTVDLRNNTTVNKLTIQSGGMLNCGNNTLTINGNLVINGELNNNRKNIFFNGDTLSGTGIKSGRRRFFFSTGTHYIAQGTNLTFSAGNVHLLTSCTVNNYGSITIVRDLRGADATSTWTNQANSTLKIGRNMLITGTLNASATGNTVEY